MGFPLSLYGYTGSGTIAVIAWNINLITNMDINNNIVIASRAYLLQTPTCTRVNNLVNANALTPMAFWCKKCFACGIA